MTRTLALVTTAALLAVAVAGLASWPGARSIAGLTRLATGTVIDIAALSGTEPRLARSDDGVALSDVDWLAAKASNVATIRCDTVGPTGAVEPVAALDRTPATMTVAPEQRL